MIKGQDMIFKFIGTHYVLVLLSILGYDVGGIDEKSIEFLTYEQVKIKPSLRRPDFILKIGRILIMIEFQSTRVNLKDAMRFDSYMATFTEEFYEKLIGNIDELRFIILSTAEKTKIKQYHRFDGCNVYFLIISRADLNKKEIISIIKEKINKHIDFSDEDAVKLALTPLMDIKKDNIESQFYQTNDLMKQGIWKNEKQKNASYAIILILMEMYFEDDNPIKKQIRDDIMKNLDSISKYAQDKFDEGRLEGRFEGKIDLLKSLLNRNLISAEYAVIELLAINCDIDTIRDISHLSKSQILNIKNGK